MVKPITAKNSRLRDGIETASVVLTNNPKSMMCGLMNFARFILATPFRKFI
jgi:hypothetical protein